MSNLSIRTRMIMLIGLFSVITLLLSGVSINSLSELRDTIDEMVDKWAQIRASGMQISRDFEAVNAEQNGAMFAFTADEITQRVQEQERLYKGIDEQLATVEKGLTGEQLDHLNRFKDSYEEYRRIDGQLRKVLLEAEGDKATRLYVKEATPLVAKLREQLGRGAEGLDKGKSPRAGAVARDLLITIVSLDDGLGAMSLETNDATLEDDAKRLGGLRQQMGVALDDLRDADAEGQRLALRVGPLVEEYRKLSVEIERGFKANTRSHCAQLALKADGVVRAARDSIHQLITRATADMDLAKRDTEQLAARARTIQLFLSVVCIVGGAVFTIFTVLQITLGVETVRRVAGELVGSAGEVKQATQSISQRTNEEASSLEETSSTMEEMTAAVEQNRAGAVKAREFAERNREAAAQGAGVAAQAAEAMRTLKDSGTKISNISDTVSEIAFQTNILALNASVEAARAGEHGRGFTVVASEVRTLAQRSGVAAREISVLIKDSLQRIDRGVELVERSSSEMSQIVEMSREVTTLVAGISAATQEQSSGIAQVTQALMQLNQVVQSNSAQSEELAATADGLDFQAQELVRAVAMISGGAEDLTARNLGGTKRPPTPPDGAPSKPNGTRKSGAIPVDPIHTNPRSSDFRSF